MKREKISDKERLVFYHAVILRFDHKSDGLYLARAAYYARSIRTPRRWVAAIDAAIRADRRLRRVE